MIAISEQPVDPDRPPAEPPSPAFRARRGRLITLAAAALGAWVLLAASAPLGAFYPLLYFGAIFAAAFLVVWLFGVVHALYAWRRTPHAGYGRALCWWLAPLALLAAVFWLARSEHPARLAYSLAKPDLDALLVEAAGVDGTNLTLPDRWLGPWPAMKITRYRTGELRLELRGTAGWSGTRGLLWSATGPPMPGRWQPNTTRDLGDGWHAWFRESMR